MRWKGSGDFTRSTLRPTAVRSSSFDSDNADVVTAAICMNVENELSLTLAPAEVAAWLGKTAEAHAC